MVTSATASSCRGRPPNAVISDVAAAVDRAVQLATDGTVVTADGETIEMPVDSLCIHSDSPGAPQVATAVRDALNGAGVELVRIADVAAVSR